MPTTSPSPSSLPRRETCIPAANRHPQLDRPPATSSPSLAADTSNGAATELAVAAVDELTTIENDEDQVVSRTFSAALLDPGPDLNSQPSKLWSSRNAFQRDHASNQPLDLSLAGVIDQFRHLNLVDDPITATSHSDIAALDMHSDQNLRNLASQPPDIPDATTLDDLSLKDTNDLSSQHPPTVDRKSQKFVNLLLNIRQRVILAQQGLMSPSDEILCNVELEINNLTLALVKVNSRKEFVARLKQAVCTELEHLKVLVTRLRENIPKAPSPLFFDSSMCSFILLRQSLVTKIYQTITIRRLLMIAALLLRSRSFSRSSVA
jgi:hypothetical protein